MTIKWVNKKESAQQKPSCLRVFHVEHNEGPRLETGHAVREEIWG